MDSSEKDVTISELNENDILKLTDDESQTEDCASLICNNKEIQDSDTSKDHKTDSIKDFNQHSVPNKIDMSDSETKSANILRMKALIDSDSDVDIIRKTLALTDSESDNKINNISNFENPDKTNKKFTKKRKKAKVIVDSSDEDDDKEKPKELEFKENDKVIIK